MVKKENGFMVSKNGILIRLTKERWLHIIEQHPEVGELRAEIAQAIQNPERILAGLEGELLAVYAIEIGKWLVVVYREIEDDGFIITAFVTRRHRALEKRTIVWPPPNNT